MTAVVFSPAPGTYASGQAVVIGEAGVTRYTIDGSAPVPSNHASTVSGGSFSPASLTASTTFLASSDDGATVYAAHYGIVSPVSTTTVFGAGVIGIERDMSLSADIGVEFGEPVGYHPVAFAMTPSDGRADFWSGDFTVWVETSEAESLEANCPPFGEGTKFALPDIDGNTIPGVLSYAANGLLNYAGAVCTGIESQGRKAPGLDLFGYKISFRLPFGGVAVSTTIPAVIAEKFGAHQFTDASSAILGTAIGANVVSYVRNGRSIDANVDCDHVTHAEAAAIALWYRGVRGAATTFPASPFGPGLTGSVTAIPRSLEMSHSAGNTWTVRVGVSFQTS